MGFWDYCSSAFCAIESFSIKLCQCADKVIMSTKEILSRSARFILGLVGLGATQEEINMANERTESYKREAKRREEEIERFKKQEEKLKKLEEEAKKAKEKELEKLEKEKRIKDSIELIKSTEREFRSIWKMKEENNWWALSLLIDQSVDNINHKIFMNNLHKLICERNIKELIEKESEVRHDLISIFETQRLAGAGKEESDRSIIIAKEQFTSGLMAQNKQIEYLSKIIEQQNLLGLQQEKTLLIEDNKKNEEEIKKLEESERSERKMIEDDQSNVSFSLLQEMFLDKENARKKEMDNKKFTKNKNNHKNNKIIKINIGENTDEKIYTINFTDFY